MNCSNTWDSRQCLKCSHNKATSSIIVQCHSQPEKTINYADSRLLGDLLQQAALEYIIPCSRPYHAFFFSLDSLSDTTYYHIFVCSPKSNLNFDVKRTGPVEIVQCEISPDESRIILLFAEPLKHEDREEYDIQIYSKRPAAYDKNFYGNMFELEQEVLGVIGCTGPPKLLFDTRVLSSRFVMLNVKSVQWNTISSFICCLDLGKGRMITPNQDPANSPFHDCVFINACYSSDGAWLLVHVIKDIWVSTVNTKRGRSIVFVHPDSLEAVKCLDVTCENLKDCWANYVPNFNRDCQQVALRFKKEIRVYRLPQPDTLQALCRIVIRNCLNDEELCRIPAAKSIMNYLHFKATKH